MESARREKSPWSILSEFWRSVVWGRRRRMWGREVTAKREKERWESLNSISKKKREREREGEGEGEWWLRRKEVERRENSDLRWGRWSSELEWRETASKKMRQEKGRGVGREVMRERRWSVRRITPEGELLRSWVRSSRTSDVGVDAVVVVRRRRGRRRRRMRSGGDILGGGLVWGRLEI
ncbi:hypothetical protein vseg_011281 [Gypsophila vaccaria]